MEGTGFNVLHEPEIKDEDSPLPTPLKETTKRNKRSEECVLPNKWSSSTYISSSSQDHSGSVAARDTHFGQSCDDSRSRHTSDSSEDAGLSQGYVVISTNELPPTEGETDRLYTLDEQMKKKTCRFKEIISKRFSLAKSFKVSKLHKFEGAGMKEHHMCTAPTPDQRIVSYELRTKENSSLRSRIEGCVTEAARVPPVGQENEEPELTSSFYSEETGEQ